MWKKEKTEDQLVRIVEELTTNRPLLKKYVQTLLYEGLLEVRLDTETGESYTDMDDDETATVYSIVLGTRQYAKEIIEEILYLHTTFSKSEMIQYKLLHEISHTWVNELIERNDRNVNILLEVCLSEHEKDKLYFTGLASFKTGRYSRSRDDGEYVVPKGVEGVKAIEEDAVELITMCLWSEKYFTSFMKFISDDQFKSVHKSLGIRTITPKQSEGLLRLISQIKNTNPLKVG